MGALSDLWKSERGLIAVVLIVAITVLACLGKVTFGDWREYTLYIYGAYVIGKTITGSVTAAKGGTADPEVAASKTTVTTDDTGKKVTEYTTPPVTP